MEEEKKEHPAVKEVNRRYNKYLRNDIEEDFAEILFRHYICGYSFEEIVKKYRGTHKEFTMRRLNDAADKFGWLDRKEGLIKRNRDQLQKETDIAAAGLLRSFNEGVTAIGDKISKDVNLYFENRNSKALPDWLKGDAADIDKMLRLFNFLSMGGMEKRSIEVNNTGKVKMQLSREAHGAMLKILSDDASEELMSQRNKAQAIDTEYTEVPQIEAPKQQEVIDEDFVKLREMVRNNESRKGNSSS